MINIDTAYRKGFKEYDFIEAEDLDALKKKLLQKGNKFVNLLLVNGFDDSWSRNKTDIPVEELSEDDIKWLNVTSNSIYSDRRYLECKV